VAEQGAPPLFAQPLAVWERDGLKAALLKAGLAADDVADPDRLFWRFERDDVPAGFAGLEIHGDDALLRSLVTLPPVRLRGIGRAIVARIETEARARGARAIYLLTTDLAGFFSELGYAACERTAVPAAIAATPQFAELCPASATAMVKRI
jgi:N-acetylglutamate synthase-like GNAT family acetyltransferase